MRFLHAVGEAGLQAVDDFTDVMVVTCGWWMMCCICDVSS